jgi:hypothetical protein
MTAGKKQTDLDKLRMSEREFDRIMRKALQVKPEDGKPKKKAKPKARKKKPSR